MRDGSRGPTIRLTVAKGCPESLGRAEDVSNPLGVLTEQMLPSTDPIVGMVCEYRWDKFVRRIDLDTERARSLSRAINRISLGDEGFTILHCLMDDSRDDIIVFKYGAAPDVDLWYHASGCPSLRNGYVAAGSPGNPNFRGNFLEQMTALTR
jgi:hypothetical protein